MKGLRLILLTFIVSGLVIVKSNAQPIQVGGGLVLASDRPSVGIKLQGTYGLDFLVNNLSSSVDVIFYIPSTPNNTKFSRFSMNLDGHYKFYTLADFNFYAIGGLNISNYSTETTNVTVLGTFTTSTSDTKAGLNLGGGAFYRLSSNLNAFSEVKYILSGFGQLELTFGVLFEL